MTAGTILAAEADGGALVDTGAPLAALEVGRLGAAGLDVLEGEPPPQRQQGGPLSDEEYLWEPVPGAWSLRPRAEARTSRPLGGGAWVLDDDWPDPDPTRPR